MIHSTGSTPNSYLYSGEQFDPALQLYYNRARYYGPNIGRFWTMDSWEGIQEDRPSRHKYLYGRNDPVNKVDPEGLYTSGEWPLTMWHVHQDAIDDVLDFLSEQDRAVLKKAVKQIDDCCVWGEAFSYVHAMNSPAFGLPKDCPAAATCAARMAANVFVRTRILEARRQQASGFRNEALRYLGYAIHTLQDSTSPEHVGFQYWKIDLKGIAQSPFHWWGEKDYPGVGSDLWYVTWNAYQYFKGAPLPNDFFPSADGFRTPFVVAGVDLNGGRLSLGIGNSVGQGVGGGASGLGF